MLLEDEKFADLVDYHREERELPEDERERLLIVSALAGLQYLADMGDTKALLFLTYEGNRGRHPENRLRRLTLPRPADLPPRFRFFETSERLSVAPAAADAPAPVPVVASVPSHRAAAALDTPERAAWVRRWMESRLATLGESEAGVDEPRRE